MVIIVICIDIAIVLYASGFIT